MKYPAQFANTHNMWWIRVNRVDARLAIYGGDAHLSLLIARAEPELAKRSR